LEFGSVPTPYIPRLYAEELALCQWYYWSLGTQTLDDYLVTGVAENTAFSVVVNTPVFPMRVVPTLIYDATKNINLRLNGAQANLPWSKFSSVSTRADHYNFQFGNITDLTFPANSVIGFAAQPNCALALDAELY
jgi:hypothetical protein